MDERIAWCPGKSLRQRIVGSVLVHPEQRLDREMFRFLVADRLQSLVDWCPNQNEAVSQLQRDLADAGLWDYQVNVPTDEAGSILVGSNVPVWERLTFLFPDLPRKPTGEQASAREELDRDQINPVERLRLWSGMLQGPRDVEAL